MTGTSHHTPGPKGPGVFLRPAGTGLLGLLLGLAIGVWISAGPPTTAESSASPAGGSSEMDSRPGRPFAEAPPDPVGERRHSERRSGGSRPPRLEVDPTVLVDLTRTSRPSLEERIVLFSNGDPIARVLAVTDDEKAVLEREWAKAKDEVVRRQRETLRHEQGENQLWIGADPFEGGHLWSHFREAALETLGPERGEAFLGMTRADEAFGGWGRRPSAAYSIQYDRQSDGSWVYRITEKPSPDGPAGKSWISNRIPAHIREMTDFLGISPEAPDS